MTVRAAVDGGVKICGPSQLTPSKLWEIVIVPFWSDATVPPTVDESKVWMTRGGLIEAPAAKGVLSVLESLVLYAANCAIAIRYAWEGP